MFELPKNYHVRVTEENQPVLAKWLEMHSPHYLTDKHIAGVTLYTGGKLSKGYNPADKIKDVGYDFGEEITYEQFKEYVLGEKFSLPDKWCIKNCLEVGTWFDEQREIGCYVVNCLEDYIHSHNLQDAKITDIEHPRHDYSSYAQNFIREGFTEITLEQFRKYVVNTPNEDYSYLIPIFKNLHIT